MIVETFFLAERNHAGRIKSFREKICFRDHAPRLGWFDGFVAVPGAVPACPAGSRTAAGASQRGINRQHSAECVKLRKAACRT
jgi:hypothetical protein